MFRTLMFVSLAGLAVTPNRPETVAKAEKRDLEPEVGDLSGYYTCKGLEVGGKAYSGIATITKKNDIYVVQWVVGSTSTFIGVGVRQGTTFSAGWSLPTDKGVIRGVNLYKIEPGPRLVGRWATLPGHGDLANETLTFLKSLEGEDD
jgi:hypothetical protein